jgi:hypothetical protein
MQASFASSWQSWVSLFRASYEYFHFSAGSWIELIMPVACSLFLLAHKIHVSNLPEGHSALQFTRNQLDRLKIGKDVTTIPWGSRRFKLPPSRITCS